MADIIHEFTVKATPQQAFPMFTTPSGLDKWWTKSSTGESREGATFHLNFGPQHDWQAKVTRYLPPSSFELQLTQAHPDWMGSRVGCDLDTVDVERRPACAKGADHVVPTAVVVRGRAGDRLVEAGVRRTVVEGTELQTAVRVEVQDPIVDPAVTCLV